MVATRLTKEDVETFILNWTTIIEEDIPRLFFAHIVEKQLNVRAITFSIEREQLAEFFDSIEPSQGADYSIKLYLGIDDNNFDPKKVGVKPGLIPILQFNKADDNPEDLGNCWALNWNFTDNLMQQASRLPLFGEILPLQGAFSFVYEWGKLNQADLADPFNGFTGEEIARIRNSTFESNDVTGILEYIQEKGGDFSQFRLDFHIGILNSRNRFHPFTYSPVLQISQLLVEEKLKTQASIVDPSTSRFFEFSSPCPPRCSKEQQQ